MADPRERSLFAYSLKGRKENYMKSPHKFPWSYVFRSIKRFSFSFLTFSLIAVGAICLQASSALGSPPGWTFRAQAYPQAFVTFMDVHFGRAWMHTVQERVVRRLYAVWCEKNDEMQKDKKER